MINREIIVSVCIITYNQKKFIAQAIEGALMQQFSGVIEIVICDDCSTDGTDSICAYYYSKYPDKIKYTHNSKNLGMIGNWINAFQSCKGRYIAFCEGDDYWTDANKLQRQVDFLEMHPEFSYCCDRFDILDELTGEIKPHADEVFVDTKDKVITVENIFNPFISKALTITFRSKFVRDLDYSSKYFRDIHLFIHLLTKGNGFCFNHVSAIYRKSQQGVWSLISDFQKKKNAYLVAFSLVAQYKVQYRSIIKFHSETFNAFINMLDIKKNIFLFLKLVSLEFHLFLLTKDKQSLIKLFRKI